MSSSSSPAWDNSSGAKLSILACCFLLSAFILGGGSRIELAGPPLLRLIAIGMLAWMLVRSTFPFRSAPRNELFYLGAVLALPLVQLIPLPPSLWQLLSGREVVIEADNLLGTPHWRPLSLTPERTANAFFALLVPLCACVFGCLMDRRGLKWLLTTIIGIALLSALMGLGQVIMGAGSPLYLYTVTNGDASVGLFSNANHHGVFLACALPCLFYLMQSALSSKDAKTIEILTLSLVVLAVLLGSTVLTFSRAGIGLFVLSLTLCLISSDKSKMALSRKTVMLGIGAGLLAILGLWAGLFWATSIGTRLVQSVMEDGRIGNVWDFATIAAHYFPWGSGLGSFQPVFMAFETVETMGLTYLNQAHNEPAQILIEAGLPGVILMVLFVYWWAQKARAAWWTKGQKAKLSAARVGTLILALCLIHSLFDYPLRTGAMACLAGLCAGLLCNERLNLRRSSFARDQSES